MKTYVVDIDDTLLKSKKVKCEHCGRMEYKNAKPIQHEIDKLNALYDEGYHIILWTGRNWDCYEKTIEQLMDHNIKHDEIVMGKPQGIYVDADSLGGLPKLEDIDD